MKTMKKILSMLLVAVMVLSFAVVASADAQDGDGEVLVINAIEGTDYAIYRLLKLDPFTGTYPAITPVKYSIDPAWAAFFNNPTIAATYVTDSNPGGNLYEIDTGKYLNLDDSNVAAFANAAREWALDPANGVTAIATKTADATGFVKFDNLDLGYYMVVPVGATQLIDGYTAFASLNTTTPEARVNVKSKKPDGTKTVTNDPQNLGLDVGEYAEFEVKYTFPNDILATDTVYNWVMEDTMSDGLTCDISDLDLHVKVVNTTTGLETSLDPRITAGPTAFGTNGFTVTVNLLGLQQYADQELIFTYHAKVNENAIVTKTLNTVDSEYGNDPSAYPNKIPGVDVEVWTNKIVIDKYKGDQNDPTMAPGNPATAGNTVERLNGAEFILIKKGATATDPDLFYKYDATTQTVSWVQNLSDATVVTTADKTVPGLDASGQPTGSNVTIKGYGEFGGVKDGTYYLREIKAPGTQADGYNLVDHDIEVTVKGEDDGTGKIVGVEVTSQIANYTGPGLPSTGGIGTTLLYVIGSCLLLGAAVILVTRKRTRSEA